MRKSFVLALVLVLAVASASLAATPTFSGNLTLEAKSDGSFTGPFEFSGRLDVNLSESGDNWSLEGRIRASWEGSDIIEVALNRYKGMISWSSGSVTAARNYELAEIKTPFKWIVQEKNPGDGKEHQLRVNTTVSNVAIDAQLLGEETKARVETTVQGFTLGAGLRYNAVSTDTDYTVYAHLPFNQFGLTAAYGAFPASGEGNDGQYAVELQFKPNANIETAVGYSSVSVKLSDVKKGINARAQVTQGLILGKVNYYEDQSVAGGNHEVKASFKYRGSENNQSFDDLFKNWDKPKDYDDDDKWYSNVAPAFGALVHTQRTDDTLVELYGVVPFATNAIARAKVDTKGGKTGYAVEARFTMSDKLVLNPFAERIRTDSDTTLGARAIYSVTEDVEFTVEATQKGDDQSLLAKLSIDF